ncbi:Pr6Pr family membrane protein [Demequina aestuarii]|uniref:Pr6Pr family membrane protein n=1 Tax=Demequina aestuarii TaxID=327095 RepID=UPI000780835C|nr:Pr6Pr family membrane protein [Demequina aestuarii]
MTTAVRIWRALTPVAILAAIAANLTTEIRSGDFVFVDYFGYFTNQTNLIAATVLIAALRSTARARPLWLELARASAVVYLLIVVIVYWILLWPTIDDVANPWANAIIHAVSGVVLLVDWLLEGPRDPISLRWAWAPALYPLVWLSVVMVRGATDGWVPYPFLDPQDGYGPVVVVLVGIVAAGVIAGSALFHVTRWRVITPTGSSV